MAWKPLDGWRVITGDAWQTAKRIKEPVATIVTDPPYGATVLDWDKAESSDTLLEMLSLPAFRDAVLCTTANMKLASRLINLAPKLFRYDLVWHKPDCATGHLNATRQPLRNHEFVLVFGKPSVVRDRFQPQFTFARPYRMLRNGKSSIYGRQRSHSYTKSSGKRYPLSVQSFRNSNNTFKSEALHPVQKPVELMAWLIRTFTKPGELVFDPFLGSGTTGVAAVQDGRRFFGCDIDAEYIRIARNRIRQSEFREETEVTSE